MGRELILNFHGIGTPHDSIGRDERAYWLPPQKFVSLLDRISTLSGSAVSRARITFDDGNLSDATVAMPELAKRGLTATFFICAGRIGAPHYLGRSALGEMLAAGMGIGTHGMRHCDWRTLDDHELDTEIGDARRLIEDICGRPVELAAIPFGSYNRRVLARLRRESLESVFTSDRGLASSNRWLKPRETVEATWSERDIERVASARGSPAARLRRRAAMLYKAWR